MQYCEISVIMYSSKLHTIVLHKVLSLKVALLVFQQYANCMDCPIARKRFSLTSVQKGKQIRATFILCCEFPEQIILQWNSTFAGMGKLDSSDVEHFT